MEWIFAEPSKPLTTRLALPILLGGGCFGASGVLEIEDVGSTDRIISIGQYDSSQNSRVVSSEGISYAVTNGYKDGMPKIIQKAINTDANGNAKAIRACYGQCGYDSVFRGTGQGITGVMEEVEPKIAASRGRGEGWKQQLEINESGTSNVITSCLKDNYVMEQNLKMDKGCLVDNDGRRYRIRKLTPRECFRLMNVKDEDIDKMINAGIAKTNLYKLAGNSIVVSCMYHIFRKLFIEKENENQQLELF